MNSQKELGITECAESTMTIVILLNNFSYHWKISQSRIDFLPHLPSQSYSLIPSFLTAHIPIKIAGVFDKVISVSMWSHQHSRKCGKICCHESSRNSSKILQRLQTKASLRTKDASNQSTQWTT